MRKLATLLLVVVSAIAIGQEVIVNGNAGLNADSSYNRLYSTKTVKTFKGVVTGIQSAPPMNGVGNVVTYVVKAQNGGTAIVDVGPEWFVNNQKTRIKMKDRVQVTGSKVLVDGRGIIIAEMIVKEKGKEVLTLRAPDGRPYWDAVAGSSYVEPSNVDTRVLAGQIIRFGTFQDGTAGLVETLTLRTDEGDVMVALAPDWYLKRQDMQVALGDNIRIYTYNTNAVPVQTGNGLPGSPIVYATNVYRGGNVILLRNGDGSPRWYPIGR